MCLRSAECNPGSRDEQFSFHLPRQVELEEAEARAAEALEEVGGLEEEKYSLVHDIEVLEEELEDANSHQKRYYEALMQKEDQVNRFKSQVGEGSRDLAGHTHHQMCL
ncbi:MAG: hypothetical protein SGPRY_001494 [Prymnesium sp.]